MKRRRGRIEERRERGRNKKCTEEVWNDNKGGREEKERYELRGMKGKKGREGRKERGRKKRAEEIWIDKSERGKEGKGEGK